MTPDELEQSLRTPAGQRAKVLFEGMAAYVKAVVAKRDARIAALETRLAELEVRLDVRPKPKLTPVKYR